VDEVSKDKLIEMMVGRKLKEAGRQRDKRTGKRKIGKGILSLKGVTRKGIIEDISFLSEKFFLQSKL